MNSRKETPEERRERLRQEELRNNPFGVFSDGVNYAECGDLSALFSGLGWKGISIIISITVIGCIIYVLIN